MEEEGEPDVPSFSDIARKLISPGRSYYTQSEMLQIYTDWANHYLERSPRHKRLIQDLQHDIADGVLLADIVEAVTNERLRDIKAKPKNATQMLENINVCLKCIENLGVNIEGLKAEDIREGNLRAILGLFFSLSRYKQQRKSGLLPPSSQSQLVPPSFTATKIPAPVAPVQNAEMLSRLPSPFKSTQSNRNSTGTIPQPASSIPSNGQNRRSLTNAQKDKVSSNGSSGIPAPRLAQTSRPVSPGTSSSPHSLIPAPSSRLPSTGDKANRQSRSSSTTSSGISASSSGNKSGSVNWSGPPPTSVPASASNHPSPAGVGTTTTTMGKSSMFGFGFFQKTKQEKSTSSKVPSTSKSAERNSGCSSSSGFSSGSGKSELSDNSSGAGSETLVSSPTFSPLPKETIYENASASITNSPKMAMKALAKRTFSRSPSAPAKEPTRLLRIEPRDDELPQSRLPTPSSNSLDTSGKKVPVSKLPRPAVQGKAEASRNGSRGLIRTPLDSLITEEEITPSLLPTPRKPDPPPTPIRSSQTETAEPARESSAKVNGTLPAPSSGIPRPLVATAKTPVKSAKLEKRLSFPPNQPPNGKETGSTDVSGIKNALEGQSTPRDSVADATDEPAAKRQETPHDTEDCSRDTGSVAGPTVAPSVDIASGQADETSNSSSNTQQSQPAEPDNSCDDAVWKLHDREGSDRNGPDNTPVTSGEITLNGQQAAETDSTTGEARDSSAESVPSPAAVVRKTSQDTDKESVGTDKQPSQPSSDANILESNSDHNQIMLKQAAANRALRAAAKPDGRKQQQPAGRADAGNGSGGGGYMSDGDILKSSTLGSQLRVFDEDLMNGYISEGSGGMAGYAGNSRRMTSRPRERMPLVRESGGRNDGFDYDDAVSSSSSSNYQNAGSDRKPTESSSSSSNFSRSFPYSSLSYRSPHYDVTEQDHTSQQRSSVPAMPLLRGPSIRSSENSHHTRTPKPAPISPPPRDPETTLSNSGYPNGSTTTDNYLRIYASPVRKPRQPTSATTGDVFAGLMRNPGELFTRPGVESGMSSTISGNNHNENFASQPRSLQERRAGGGSQPAKSSGSTQTSPQDSVRQSGSHYSTNSLNRNMNGYSLTAQDAPPRCRSVVQSHGEMSVAQPAPAGYSNELSSVGMVNPYLPTSGMSVYDAVPMSPKVAKGSPSRFSMPNQQQELSVYDVDRITAAPVAALPPKASRPLPRHSGNGHSDASSHEAKDYERNSRSNGAPSQHGVYSRSSAAREPHFRDNGVNGAATWDSHRSPSHSARGYPLTYSMNTHGPNYTADDLDSASTVSFPLSSTSRLSAPASPILTYSLPRQGQSNHLSLRSNPGVSPYVGSLLSKIHAKDDEAHGSTGSLISTVSSIYSTPEERHAHGVRKLRQELEQAQDRVASLTNQLSTNGHVVAAFENSLNNMQYHLDVLTASAHRKDGELVDLRRTIENLRQQGAEAGLISAAACAPTNVVSPNLVRRHTFNSAKDGPGETDERPPGLSRQMSTDSVASLNSLASNCSANELDEDGKKKNGNKKKSWLRSSFSKAFSRGRPKTKNGSTSDAEDSRNHLPDLSTSVPNSPLLQASRTTSRVTVSTSRSVSRNSNDYQAALKSASSFSALDRMDEREETGTLEDLQRQLREKEMVLNDFRLEALNSAQQLDQYKESMTLMKSEIENLRQDNMRLQRLVAVKRRSLSSERKSPHDGNARSTPSESGIGDDESPTFDARRIAVKVVTFENGSTTKADFEEVSIGSVKINSVMRWDQLDKAVRQLFKEYILRLDVMSNLGLSTDSMACYHLGNALRNRDDLTSLDSSPIDYVKSDDEKIRVILKGSREHALDLIAFESLLPKSILQRHVSQITEHKRVILRGPPGTGKSFLARKIAQHLVLKSGRQTTEDAIATFCVDQTTAKDLRQYLMQIADQCENSRDLEVPTVVIIDNLHHVASLGELFNGFLSVKHQRCPFIIGTMNQSTCKAGNLNLHHNFRWILCANHMEPVKGFLNRFLRRKIIEHEMNAGVCDSALTKIVEWIPRVWQHVNSLLEKHSSSDVTVGPRRFLDCPMNVRESQLWFTSLWNYSLVPYILEAVKEGLQKYGRCDGVWENPTEWIMETYPWPTIGSQEDTEMQALNPIRQEDVGFESFGLNSRTKTTSADGVTEAEIDPLSNMLLQLQEAARYSNHQNDLAALDGSSLEPLSDHLTKSSTCA